MREGRGGGKKIKEKKKKKGDIWRHRVGGDAWKRDPSELKSPHAKREKGRLVSRKESRGVFYRMVKGCQKNFFRAKTREEQISAAQVIRNHQDETAQHSGWNTRLWKGKLQRKEF